MESNENIRKERGLEVSVGTKMNINKLRWFEHVEEWMQTVLQKEFIRLKGKM
jgi:hypothetical protein